MADIPIDSLTSIPSIDRTTDVVPVVDTSANTTYKVTVNNMLGFTGGDPVSSSDTQTLTNKTITAPTISAPVLSGTVTGTYTLGGTVTFPAAVVTLTGSQTLTNKVLTSPTINTATIVNPTLTTDAVTGHTDSDSGVAYGVTVTNGIIQGTVLADAGVQPKNLLAGTGTSWAWQSWSPTWTNLSGGTTTYAKYIQIGKTVFFRFRYTLAGAGVSGDVSLTAPVAFHADYTLAGSDAIGQATYRDAGTNLFPGIVYWTSGGNMVLRALNTAGTYESSLAPLSSTIPHTWANTDSIYGEGKYEAA